MLRSFRRVTAVVLGVVLVATGCQMRDGNQYFETSTSWFVSSTTTAELALWHDQQCHGVGQCLADALTSSFVTNPSDMDSSGAALVDALIDHAATGLLDGPLTTAAAGECIEVPKSGAAPSVEPASSSECIEGSSLGGPALSCDFSMLPSGDVGVTWTNWDDHQVTVERSDDDGGTWTSIYTGQFAGGAEHLDDDAPLATTRYRIRSTVEGSPVSTVTCEEVPYQVSVDAADVPVPRTPTGDIGGVGPGATQPTPIPPEPQAPASDPVLAPTLCGVAGGGGATGTGLRHNVHPTLAPPGFTRVTLPARTYLEFDVVNTKAPFTDNGNWIWYTDLHAINSDGTMGSRVDRTGGPLGYYWDDRTSVSKDRQLENTATSPRTLLLRTSATTVTGLDPATQAYFELSDIKIRRLSDDEIVGMPCTPAAMANCHADGGDIYLPEVVEIDGEEMVGCYSHHSCVTDLSPNLDFIVFDLNDIGHWACENDEILEAAAVLGLVVIIVAGVILFAPSAAAAVASAKAYLLSVGGSELGATTLQVAVGTTAGTVTVIYLTWAVTDEERMAALTEALPEIEVPTLDYTTAPDTVVVGHAVALQLYERTGYDDAIRSSDPEPVRSLHRQLIIRALQACVADLTVQIAQDIASSVAPGHVVDHIDDVYPEIGGVKRHLCEMIDIYIPGGTTRTTGRPMGQATAHVNEVLYGTPPIAAASHTGTQPPLPQSEWTYLHRGAAGRSTWYTDPPYSCEGSVAARTDCDEWPWQATEEGGPPTAAKPLPAHLRIIERGDNRAGGREFQTFLGRCNVSNGEAFMVLPQPLELLAVGWDPDGDLEPVPSTWVGPTCQW